MFRYLRNIHHLANIQSSSLNYQVMAFLKIRSLVNVVSFWQKSTGKYEKYLQGIRRSLQISVLHKTDGVTIHFVDRNGIMMSVAADVGENMLDVAKDYDIDGVEGACGGTLACSTCHCIFSEEDFARLNFEDDLTEEEIDMLDLAYGVTDSSRLVCQVELSKEMDGLTVIVPAATNDARN